MVAQKPFRSILFGDEIVDPTAVDSLPVPECFRDLNLDQVVDSITAGRDEYNLKPFFYAPLNEVDLINYRYEVLRDLEDPGLLGHLHIFATGMRTMRAHLAQADKAYYRHQKDSWFLDAVGAYCGAVSRLSSEITSIELRSRALRGARDYLAGYISSGAFEALAADSRKLAADLAAIQYSLHIHGKRIKVGRFGAEPDYGADVLATFENFKQAAPKEYHFRYSASADMNHIEAAILDLIAKLHPETFGTLDEFPMSHAGYLNPVVARFDREIQFYIACLEFIENFKRAGFSFCQPEITDRSKAVFSRDGFDLALANRLVKEGKPVVTNDFSLQGLERSIVVSGPNQGGKTTFARSFGQLHYLGSIGCPVPGTAAKLFLSDRIFTHFEREEDVWTLSSKLEDELTRIHQILGQATSSSILIMNESFLSTTLDDALFLSKQIMQRIADLDLLCVSVTFLDELASLNETTISMVSTIQPEDPALRTFKVVRRPPDGLAYAVAIAEKHRLTYEVLKARIVNREAGEARP